ncbi:MAG: hypothetical protein KC469_13520 [Flavobacteriaceae bacterium]|nr:hypothetical protein [Flavobacteriaceae bacterium]
MFKQRKHKKFNYKPKYSGKNGGISKGEDEVDLDEFRSKWNRQRYSASNKRKRAFSTSTLIIILVLLLICMYFLDWKFM